MPVHCGPRTLNPFSSKSTEVMSGGRIQFGSAQRPNVTQGQSTQRKDVFSRLGGGSSGGSSGNRPASLSDDRQYASQHQQQSSRGSGSGHDRGWRQACQQDLEDRPRWSLSCYGRDHRPNEIMGDTSPEEVRWADLRELRSGQAGRQQLESRWQAARALKEKQFKALLASREQPSAMGAPILEAQNPYTGQQPAPSGPLGPPPQQPLSFGAQPGAGFGSQPGGHRRITFGQAEQSGHQAPPNPFEQAWGFEQQPAPQGNPFGQQQHVQPFGQPLNIFPATPSSFMTPAQQRPVFGGGVAAALQSPEPGHFAATSGRERVVFGRGQQQQRDEGSGWQQPALVDGLVRQQQPALASPFGTQQPAASVFQWKGPKKANAQQQPSQGSGNSQLQAASSSGAQAAGLRQQDPWAAPNFEYQKIPEVPPPPEVCF